MVTTGIRMVLPGTWDRLHGSTEVMESINADVRGKIKSHDELRLRNNV